VCAAGWSDLFSFFICLGVSGVCIFACTKNWEVYCLEERKIDNLCERNDGDYDELLVMDKPG